MKIHIQHGRLLDPANGVNQQADVFIAAGKIVGINHPPSGFVAHKTLDARGCIVVPGLVDLCARLGEPGGEHKATLHSELQAAVAGGVTSLACPPDTDPVLDEPGLVKTLRQNALQLQLASVYPIGAMTRALDGQTLAEMNELSAAGCVGFSQANVPISDTRVLWRAFEYAATFGFTLFLHAEEPFLAQGGTAHDGEVATRLGLKGIPVSAESLALMGLLHIAQKTGCRLHISRISSAEGVDILRASKALGALVTADVSAHHLHYTHYDLAYFNSYCHLKPPLRSPRDRDALRRALADGTLDAIISDHSPVDDDAKLVPFAESQLGATGLETLLSLAIKWGMEDGIALDTTIARITQAPAAILGLPVGQLAINSVADVCVVDVDAAWQVNVNNLRSLGKNSPCLGQELPAVVRYTLVGGHIVYPGAL